MTPEDSKLVTLARAARARAYAPYQQGGGATEGATEGAAEGAAVRDADGRSYAAATVANVDPSLTTSALRGAVVAAVSSGARRFEAAAVVTTAGQPTAADLAVLAEFGRGTPVIVAAPDGTVRGTFPADR
ncbi:MAG: cytidine deaminase [Mycobacteriales bacterium]